MSEIKDGGSAFPLGANEYAGHGPVWGMTLRDYFAAKAMQGDLASWPGTMEAADYVNQIGERAYLIADAMLRAREH